MEPDRSLQYDAAPHRGGASPVLDRGVEEGAAEILYVESGTGFLTRTLRSRDVREGSISPEGRVTVWAAPSRVMSFPMVKSSGKAGVEVYFGHFGPG